MKTEYLLIIILIFILIKITRIAKIVSSKHLFKYILYQVNKNKVYNVLKIKLIFLIETYLFMFVPSSETKKKFTLVIIFIGLA